MHCVLIWEINASATKEFFSNVQIWTGFRGCWRGPRWGPMKKTHRGQRPVFAPRGKIWSSGLKLALRGELHQNVCELGTLYFCFILKKSRNFGFCVVSQPVARVQSFLFHVRLFMLCYGHYFIFINILFIIIFFTNICFKKSSQRPKAVIVKAYNA
jgi:hypothetical protein